MNPDFKLLAECYQSDLARLDASAEVAWYLAQLNTDSEEDFDFTAFVENCRKEQNDIRLKLKDLENLMAS